MPVVDVNKENIFLEKLYKISEKMVSNTIEKIKNNRKIFFEVYIDFLKDIKIIGKIIKM